LKEGITLFEREIYTDIARKQLRQMTFSIPNKYSYLEDDKTSGYVSYGGIMMPINTHKEVRMTEKDKLRFD
jgi:ppGpp synthetase/RelA/SpoT-type nucleotidyltranferase